MFCLQSHYRKPLEFSYAALDNVASAYERLKSRIAALKPDGEPDMEAAAPYRTEFAEVLCNDLNTSMALTKVYDIFKAPLDDATKLWLIKDFDTVLSLNLVSEKEESHTDTDDGLVAIIEAKISERAEAKKARDYAKADAIRDELKAMGIQLKDSKEGTTWEKI